MYKEDLAYKKYNYLTILRFGWVLWHINHCWLFKTTMVDMP